MWRRLLICAGVLLGLGLTWNEIALYFGRYDAEAWSAEHLPPPAAPLQKLGRHQVEVVDTRQVVPSRGMPRTLDLHHGNNNLDVIRFADRVYLAFRNAPSHFAGDDVAIHVVSSSDETSWRHENSFRTGADLREPRFLELDGRLLLYVTRLGSNPFAFEPKGISVSELRNGTFGALEAIYEPGYVLWRARVVEGKPFLTVYGGGGDLYSFTGGSLRVEMLTTKDGRNLVAASANGPEVYVGGGSETDFTVLESKGLFGVIRNEAGDASGWGSKLCRSQNQGFGNWRCITVPRKYDSPLVFEHQGEVYVIARRHLTDTGHYAIHESPIRVLTTIQNQLDYIVAPKRCSLWRWVQGEQRLAFILDLPSRGDTCFASKLDTEDDNQFVIYNYSSDIHGPDVPWSVGQRDPTQIYRHILRFTPKPNQAERR